MERIIKFRAWDGKQKMMFTADYTDYVSFQGRAMMQARKTYDTPNIEIEYADDYVVMQFTGLKDKNGKEIYEGDVVNADGIRFVVIWEKGSAGFRFGLTENTNLIDTESPMNYDFLEVIGNIYSDPELLK